MALNFIKASGNIITEDFCISLASETKAEYVKDNNIERPLDLLVKTIVKKSSNKVYIETYFIENICENASLISKYVAKELEKRIPIGRMAKKDEYQGIVIFLLSNASSYLNGAIIPADGGRTACL